MTREEIEELKGLAASMGLYDDKNPCKRAVILGKAIKALEQDLKIGHCKDCKWWKDSDGGFRRGISAESQCPMNRIEVFEGNGYCFLFEPQEGGNQ